MVQLNYTSEVPGSDFGPGTSYPDWHYSEFTWVPAANAGMLP